MVHGSSVRAAGVLALASLLLAAAIAPASAMAQSTEQPATRPAVRLGSLSQPSPTGFTLETRGGNVSVTISAETWIVVEKNGRAVEGSASDLKVGKATAVAGMLSTDSKSLAARTVAQGQAARRLADRLARVPRRPLVRAMQHLSSGTITAFEGTRITLRGDRTPQVVVLTRPETLVLRGEFSEVGTLKVGEHVQVLGVPMRSATQDTATRTLEAWAIRVDGGATGFAHGRVRSVDGDALVLLNVVGRDRITVNVDGSTQYKRLTVSNGQPVITAATQSDLKAGAHIAVDGPVSSDGRSIQAKAVIILGAPLNSGP